MCKIIFECSRFEYRLKKLPFSHNSRYLILFMGIPAYFKILHTCKVIKNDCFCILRLITGRLNNIMFTFLNTAFWILFFIAGHLLYVLNFAEVLVSPCHTDIQYLRSSTKGGLYNSLIQLSIR